MGNELGSRGRGAQDGEASIPPGPEGPGSQAKAPRGLKRALQRSFAVESGDSSPGERAFTPLVTQHLSRIAEQLGKPVLWLGTQAIEVFFEVRIAIFVSVAVSVLWILRIEVMGRFPGVGHAVAVRVFGGRLAFEFGPAAYLVLRIKQFARLISYRRCCCGNR